MSRRKQFDNNDSKTNRAALYRMYKGIEVDLFESLNKLRISESETRRRIVEKKKKLVEWLNEAERIILDDLKKQSDWKAEVITEQFQEVNKLQEWVASGNKLDVYKKLRAIRTEIGKLKLKFPYHKSLFQKVVDLDGKIGISERCGSKKCKTCQHMKETTIFTSTVTGEIFIIKQDMNCGTENVIYLLTCSCKKQYVGMTLPALRDRIGKHRRGSTTLSRHLETHETQEFEVIAIEAIDSDEICPCTKLRERKKHWIEKLETMPDGLNKRY